jgi:hypothetical protein
MQHSNPLCSIVGGFTRIAARSKTRIVRIGNGVDGIYEVNIDYVSASMIVISF